MIAAERKSDASMVLILVNAARQLALLKLEKVPSIIIPMRPAMSLSAEHSHSRTGRRTERLRMDVAELKQRPDLSTTKYYLVI